MILKRKMEGEKNEKTEQFLTIWINLIKIVSGKNLRFIFDNIIVEIPYQNTSQP